jgi:hypothetical protein
MWWRKPGDTEPELSWYEGNEAFLNKLAAPTNTSHKHYGFTDEELDFIINYDIKYRMGIK